jgi:steroid delta-isomerase
VSQASNVVAAYLAALQAADLEGIVGLYAEDASIEDPVGSDLVVGQAAIRAFYAKAVGTIDQAYLVGSTRESSNEVAFAFELIIPMGDNKMVMDIIDVFSFNSDGKIQTMRAFWGKGNMRPL